MPKLAVVVLPLLLLFSAAEAADTRYVASNGTANDTCSRNAPCNTLQRAVNVSSAGGEVIVLDSGSYGNSLTINRSITISADGITATLIDPGNVTIDNANAIVVLRGLHLKGAGGPGVTSGVFITEAAAVHIERCTIERFASTGIRLFDNNGTLFVTDSIVRNNGGGGLLASGAADTGRTLTVDNSRFENNGGDGVSVVGGRATITRSVASGNGGSGVSLANSVANITWTTASHNGDYGFALVSVGAQMTLESSVARHNGIGLWVATGTARISRSVFTDNDIGIRNDSTGTLQRLQNNTLEGNGTNLSNTGTELLTAPF